VLSCGKMFSGLLANVAIFSSSLETTFRSLQLLVSASLGVISAPL